MAVLFLLTIILGLEVLWFEANLLQLIHQLEVVHVNLGTWLQLLAVEVVIDRLYRNRSLTDRSGQQMWTDNITRYKVARLALDLIVLGGINQTTTIIQVLITSKITGLSDCRGDQRTLQHLFGAFDHFRLTGFIT